MKKTLIFIAIAIGIASCKKEGTPTEQTQEETKTSNEQASQGQKKTPKIGVIFHGQCNYKGWHSEPLDEGSYNTARLKEFGVKDNDISSIEIPLGWAVALYNGGDFTDGGVEFHVANFFEPVACLATYQFTVIGDNFVDTFYLDNEVSSVRISH